MRIIVAFLVAPFPAALVQALVVGFWPKPGQGVFENPASMFVAICLFFYAFEIVLGLPLALLLRRRFSPSLRLYAVVGSAAAAAPVAIMLGLTAVRGELALYGAVYTLALFGLGGLTAGAVFWQIARPDRRRGERDHASELAGRFS